MSDSVVQKLSGSETLLNGTLSNKKDTPWIHEPTIEQADPRTKGRMVEPTDHWSGP